MLFAEHPAFEAPEDPAVKIWRYMSVAKFLRLVGTSVLWFTVATRFEDPWEGMMPVENKRQWGEMLIASYESTREENALNCWHMNAGESAALWKIYSPSAEGIVIQSTYERLVQCFREASLLPEAATVMVGVVRYIDFETEMIPPEPGGTAPNAFLPITYKRRFFEYERELRAVLSPQQGTMLFEAFRQRAAEGCNVRVDLTTLIETVYVAGPEWLLRIVTDITPVGLRGRVQPSRFLKAPPGAARGFWWPRSPGIL